MNIKPVFLLCLLFFNSSVKSQAIYKFVSANVLNIRSKPSLEGEIVDQIKKGDLVMIVEELNDYLIIDGIKSHWNKIEFNNTEGFVFDAYLSGKRIIHNANDTFDIVFSMYHDLEYNPDLNWYGVYLTDNGEKINKVNPVPILERVSDDFEGISFFTNDEIKYEFFIGTKEVLSSGIIGIGKYFENTFLDKSHFDLILYNDDYNFSRGQRLDVKYRVSSDRNKFREFALNYNNNVFDYESNVKVPIYKFIEGYTNQIPTLLWYGDLDGDKLPEFIFALNGDNRGFEYEFVKIYRNGKGKLKSKKLMSKKPEFAGGC